MELKKIYCVVKNSPIYTAEGSENRLEVIKEFESLDQLTAYYRDGDEDVNENHPAFPEKARVIEVYVSTREKQIII